MSYRVTYLYNYCVTRNTVLTSWQAERLTVKLKTLFSKQHRWVWTYDTAAHNTVLEQELQTSIFLCVTLDYIRYYWSSIEQGLFWRENLVQRSRVDMSIGMPKRVEYSRQFLADNRDWFYPWDRLCIKFVSLVFIFSTRDDNESSREIILCFI